jgi:hypothetical protein
MLQALACGGKVESQGSEPQNAAPTMSPPYLGATPPPRRRPAPPASAPPQAPVPASILGMQPMVAPAPDPGGEYPIYTPDSPKAAAQAVLIAYCRDCHGPNAPVEGSGGIRFIGDLEQLVAAGLIVPLSSATSRIVIVMREGSMPPPSAGVLPVTEADLEIVTRYIDNPFFFPGVTPPGQLSGPTAGEPTAGDPTADDPAAGAPLPAAPPEGEPPPAAPPPEVAPPLAADAGVDVGGEVGTESPIGGADAVDEPPLVGAPDAGADPAE